MSSSATKSSTESQLRPRPALIRSRRRLAQSSNPVNTGVDVPEPLKVPSRLMSGARLFQYKGDPVSAAVLRAMSTVLGGYGCVLPFGKGMPLQNLFAAGNALLKDSVPETSGSYQAVRYRSVPKPGGLICVSSIEGGSAPLN